MPSLHSSRASAAFVVVLAFVAVVVVECSTNPNPNPNPTAPCSRQCTAERCDTLTINYGKYCGAGYTGCPGEPACDDLDACCMNHDDCVDKFGMLHVRCHQRLKNCLTRVQKSGKAGFSKECPVSTAAPTMINGMDLAITLSQLANRKPLPQT